jgi:hypothetical protein
MVGFIFLIIRWFHFVRDCRPYTHVAVKDRAKLLADSVNLSVSEAGIDDTVSGLIPRQRHLPDFPSVRHGGPVVSQEPFAHEDQGEDEAKL